MKSILPSLRGWVNVTITYFDEMIIMCYKSNTFIRVFVPILAKKGP